MRDAIPIPGAENDLEAAMVITDFKRICPRCKGGGHQPGFSALGISQINYDGRCPECAGRGFQLTELGQDLLELLRPFVEEMIAERKKETPPEKRDDLQA